MKVYLTEIAIGDLLGIADFIARDDAQAAGKLVDELYERCLELGDLTSAFPLIGFGSLRRRTHRNYSIFYRVRRGRVEIVRVLHGARNADVLLRKRF